MSERESDYDSGTLIVNSIKEHVLSDQDFFDKKREPSKLMSSKPMIFKKRSGELF